MAHRAGTMGAKFEKRPASAKPARAIEVDESGGDEEIIVGPSNSSSSVTTTTTRTTTMHHGSLLLLGPNAENLAEASHGSFDASKLEPEEKCRHLRAPCHLRSGSAIEPAAAAGRTSRRSSLSPFYRKHGES
jgi:hypothetical protein